MEENNVSSAMQLTVKRWLVLLTIVILEQKKDNTALKIFVMDDNALKEQICIFDITVHDLIPS